MKHVVMFSGGIGSWATAKRVAKRYGAENLTLLFADVKGNNPDPNVGEDPDTYRFLEDAAADVGAPLVRVADGRDIWQLFKDVRMLGNSRIAPCSHKLKQDVCRRWLEANTDPKTTRLYVGIGAFEIHRLPDIERNWLPYKALAPLTKRPYLDRDDMLDWARSEGLEPPALYALDYPHNNCGGGCVRAGQAQFIKLLQDNPQRFAAWEAGEKSVRRHLDKNVAILRDRRGGTSKPLPLSVLRKRFNNEPETVDMDDIGGCGCFTDYDDTAS